VGWEIESECRGAEESIEFGCVDERGHSFAGVEERGWETGECFCGGVETFDPVAFFTCLVRFGEYLVRSLPEVVDDAYCGETFDGIGDVVEIFGAVVGEVVEDVYGFDGSFSALFATKDEVNPLMEMAAYVGAFESFAVFGNEDFGVAFGPGREFDGVDCTTISLSHAEIVAVAVSEEFGEVEELRNEFSDIGHVVSGGRLPRLLD
jgi:hypothetical protein